MGANIGTTMTTQILRLTNLEGDSSGPAILQLCKPSNFSSILIVIGLIIIMVGKKNKTKNVGEIMMGIGILFTGMILMQEKIAPLAELPQFEQLFAVLKNPVLGVLVGAIFTAIIQSSAASIGILQALSVSGAITFAYAFPIIMGTNIGTCATPLISSIGASKNAKRAAMIHFYFNLIGTIIFLIGVYIIQYTIGFPFWNNSFTTGSIANFHTIFNVWSNKKSVVKKILLSKSIIVLSVLLISDSPFGKFFKHCIERQKDYSYSKRCYRTGYRGSCSNGCAGTEEFHIGKRAL